MQKREIIIAGNWKMNTSPSEGIGLATRVAETARDTNGVRVVICPPATHLMGISQILASHYADPQRPRLELGDKISIGQRRGHLPAKSLRRC